MLHTTTPPWKQPNPHGATATAAPAVLPPPGLNLGADDIWYGRGFSLPQAILGVQLVNYYVMLLT